MSLYAVDFPVEGPLELGLTLLIVSLYRPLPVQFVVQAMDISQGRLDRGHQLQRTTNTDTQFASSSSVRL